jgi:hypothetical protein
MKLLNFGVQYSSLKVLLQTGLSTKIADLAIAGGGGVGEFGEGGAFVSGAGGMVREQRE